MGRIVLLWLWRRRRTWRRVLFEHRRSTGACAEEYRRGEVLEFRVDGQSVLDQIDDEVDAEGIEVNFFWNMDLPKEDIDDLSEMLTQTFRAWADKHGCAKFVEYITDVKKYDLETGRTV